MTMTEIFETQIKFQNVLSSEIHSDEYISLMLLGLFEESVEVKKTFKLKKHRKNDKANFKHAKKEIADVFIYAINICLALDITADELIDLIKKKQKINFKRIR
jgi:NTP pyrophosphatase (non-canonical NTP hydrolase)